MTSVTPRGQPDLSINAELTMQDVSHVDRHNTRGAFHNTSGAWSGGLNSGIYRDSSLHVTSHNHSQLAPFLMPQIPRRLKNLTLSGSSGPPFWELANTSPKGPHLSLPTICDHFTEGMSGHLDIYSLNLSLLDDDTYERFLQLVGSAPGRSGALSIGLSYPAFRTITDIARLLTWCTSAGTIKARELTVINGLRMEEMFTSDVQWAQRKVFVGREGEFYLFSIMLDKHVLLDKLAVLVISDISRRTMLQLREIMRKAGPALRVLDFPLLSCDLGLLPPLDLSLNTSLRALTISHSLMVGNPILISSYVRQCLETLLIPANRWRIMSLRRFKLKVLMGSDQCIDAMDLGPIDALLCHSAPALKRMVIVLHVPDWSPGRMAEEQAVIWRMMPLCAAKRDVLLQLRVIARKGH
ncbi:hypothetical protein ARMGADRAFT_1061646 [Armillaria gallica]|uniref:Uncharacterized protein n=1 Tax=Armillaria gallica TaxID=47427 RepID=A0A2H3DKU1_ARMGA|nr:hypothetical protein ARMGADRAFT_1061646 [Armillaria gallica]